jgi:hypothetical protein
MAMKREIGADELSDDTHAFDGTYIDWPRNPLN